MLKTLKEYIGGFRLGYVDNITPMASLGDTPPKGQAGKDSRGVGLHANYTTQGVGTIKPMLTAKKMSPFKKKILQKLSKPIKDYLKTKKEDAKKLQQTNWKEKGFGPYKFQKEDTKRIPRKPGQKAGSDKHSDLYTDENPRGTIHGLGFTDAETARTSVNKIKNSGKTHAHKIQAAIAMSQRAKVASERAKDPKKKKDLAAAHKVYQSFIDTNKKKDK